MKLKPFDLEAALQGAAVVTELGIEVTEIHRFNTAVETCKVRAVISGYLCSVKEGKYFDGYQWYRLYMKPTQVTKWVNIYKNSAGHHCGNHLYLTKEQALKNNEGVVDTIQITFED